MSDSPGSVFGSLRARVLDRLVEVRATIDDAYGGLSPESAREEFSTVLQQFQQCLADNDEGSFRDFFGRWVALRVGEGLSPRSLLHSVVALGDVVVQVAKTELASEPETNQFIGEVVKLNFLAARTVVDLLADDLDRKLAELRQAGGGLWVRQSFAPAAPAIPATCARKTRIPTWSTPS